MKVSHETLVKLAELGIMRSIPDFLEEPLKPGRLKRLFGDIIFIVDQELAKIYKFNGNIFEDNISEITKYVNRFGDILHKGGLQKEDIHVASVVCFCLSFLKDSKSKYPDELNKYLVDVVDYYERVDNASYIDFMKGRNFYEEWEMINGAN